VKGLRENNIKNTMDCQTFAEYVEDIKESLTDAQYKKGMDLCQELFKQVEPDEKLYRMTYMCPSVYSDWHTCEDDECIHSQNRCLNVTFTKKTAYIKLKPELAEEILEDNCFRGDNIGDFIEVDVLGNHQEYEEDIPEFEWDTFPVLKLDLV
jgi:hypothetical protein